MKKLLMASPRHFTVSYEINPWMNEQQGLVNTQVAEVQWTNLLHAVCKEVATHIIHGPAGLPDMVFTANAGFVRGKIAVVSNFKHDERKGEERWFADWFAEQGYTVHTVINSYEGQGDHLVDSRGRHWMGFGFRTDFGAAEEVGEILGVNIQPLRLVDERWYHLDTCFFAVDSDTVVWYPPAFCESSQAIVRASFAKTIDISESDALKFSCNAIRIADKIFMPAGSAVAAQLREQFTVCEFDLSEFMRAGGAAKCLILEINE